jgi:hypothetical protein
LRISFLDTVGKATDAIVAGLGLHELAGHMPTSVEMLDQGYRHLAWPAPSRPRS